MITLTLLFVLYSIFFCMSLDVLSGSSGNSKTEPFFIFDLSIPAFAQIKPCFVLAIIVSPLFLKISKDSFSINSTIFSKLFSINLFSTLDTIFWVTTITSLSSRAILLFSNPFINSSAKSCLGENSGRFLIGMIVILFMVNNESS